MPFSLHFPRPAPATVAGARPAGAFVGTLLVLVVAFAGAPSESEAQRSESRLVTVTFTGGEDGFDRAYVDIEYAFLICAGELHIHYRLLPGTVETGRWYNLNNRIVPAPSGVDFQIESVRFQGYVRGYFAGSAIPTSVGGRFDDPYTVPHSGAGCYGQTSQIASDAYEVMENLRYDDVERFLNSLEVRPLTQANLRNVAVESAIRSRNEGEAGRSPSTAQSTASNTPSRSAAEHLRFYAQGQWATAEVHYARREWAQARALYQEIVNSPHAHFNPYREGAAARLADLNAMETLSDLSHLSEVTGLSMGIGLGQSYFEDDGGLLGVGIGRNINALGVTAFADLKLPVASIPFFATEDDADYTERTSYAFALGSTLPYLRLDIGWAGYVGLHAAYVRQATNLQGLNLGMIGINIHSGYDPSLIRFDTVIVNGEPRFGFSLIMYFDF